MTAQLEAATRAIKERDTRLERLADFQRQKDELTATIERLTAEVERERREREADVLALQLRNLKDRETATEGACMVVNRHRKCVLMKHQPFCTAHSLSALHLHRANKRIKWRASSVQFPPCTRYPSRLHAVLTHRLREAKSSIMTHAANRLDDITKRILAENEQLVTGASMSNCARLALSRYRIGFTDAA